MIQSNSLGMGSYLPKAKGCFRVTGQREGQSNPAAFAAGLVLLGKNLPWQSFHKPCMFVCLMTRALGRVNPEPIPIH